MPTTNKKGSSIKEGLADLAQVAEQDHEVQMARAELYKLAKYSIKLHEMLKSISEQEGLEGWVQSKITKAADYISSVYHHLDYDIKFAEEVVSERKVGGELMCPEACCGKPIMECHCGPECPHCNCHEIQRLSENKKVQEGDGIYHDCAKSFKHKTYGECTVIPGEHTLLEDGTVTHYDATFNSCGEKYIVRNVPVSNMTDIISEGHTHASKKKSKKRISEKGRGSITSRSVSDQGVRTTSSQVTGNTRTSSSAGITTTNRKGQKTKHQTPRVAGLQVTRNFDPSSGKQTDSSTSYKGKHRDPKSGRMLNYDLTGAGDTNIKNLKTAKVSSGPISVSHDADKKLSKINYNMGPGNKMTFSKAKGQDAKIRVVSPGRGMDRTRKVKSIDDLSMTKRNPQNVPSRGFRSS